MLGYVFSSSFMQFLFILITLRDFFGCNGEYHLTCCVYRLLSSIPNRKTRLKSVINTKKNLSRLNILFFSLLISIRTSADY